MVRYTLAGRVNSEEYAICDRLLDILEATLPDCQVTKRPSRADHWPNDAAELMRVYGFNLPTSSKLVISDVAIWNDTGRLLCSDVDEFSTFVGRKYGIQLDLTEAEVLLYIKTNFPMAISRMKAVASTLLRARQVAHGTTQHLAFSTEATDAAAAALRMGFKKAQKDDIDAPKVEVTPESPTEVSSVSLPVVEKKLVPPVMTSTQPLWLTQDLPATDLSGFAPKIVVVGVGGAGGNAVNNMIARGLQGVEFLVCNTDAQHLRTTLTENRVQMAPELTGGLGCGANPEVGREAAEAAIDEILERVQGANMMFVTAGMGGGTGTGAAPVIAQAALDAGILTVAVVTKPFRFEGNNRAKLAAQGLAELKDSVDTMLVIPNQNLFNMSNERTSLMDAFRMADNVLLDGVKNISDLMVMPGLINLDFADVQSVMQNMGNAMMGSGEADGDNRALRAAEDALANPLLGDISIKDAKGMIVNITGGSDLTLFEVDEAAERVTRELDDPHANIIFGSTFDDSLDGKLRVSVVATGIADPEKL
ncbi:Cell division protein FtsZ [Phytophthora citrophthora]|uniref:Cell division protein FtsZ n=1 Tax=Phytophthora citrophthora TaxID=4793 RepID=A0AAD9H1U8_9STRA|nr:Cell division protein FtsZ [Phytophthora citrophthora]